MTSDTPSKPTESRQEVTGLTQELRFATTMTGGVSLAVWMAGVAREINLLAQASEWRMACPTKSQPTDAPSAASRQLYRKLIDLLDVVVDVDVLSGTSAGGINAALLASSRVTGSDLGKLRDLWLDLGALTDLLRDPADKNTPSLLYGDERMFAVLAEQLPNLAKGPFPPGTPPSTTLYVTTTLLTGEISQFTDSFGTFVQDVDRRGVFTFTETELGDKATYPALALAARSSASFPLAFEPSFIPFTDPTPEKGDVPTRPPMANYANITRPHWVADGGLLDNQPIDVLLRRVFDRPARRPVRRVLLFVVPSSGPAPELSEEAPPDDVNQPLGLVEGLLKDLSAMTTQSIAADLRAIRAHQDRMESRTNTRLRLAELAAALPEQERLLTPSLLRDYTTREATKLAHALTSAMLRQLSTWPPESGASTESVPTNWQAQLAVGGDAEKVCRQAIEEAILRRWSQPLPQRLVELARYGQPALDVTKGCALSVFEAAYQLATSPADIAEMAELTEKVHEACEPPKPANPDEPVRPNPVELVRMVCTSPVFRRGSLANAAAQVALDNLDRSTVQAEAWAKLDQAFEDKYSTLRRLADNAPSGSEVPTNPMSKDPTTDNELSTYLKYLKPEDNAHSVAMKLFDLAATQRAMLPAEADIEQSLELVQVSADTRSLLAPEFKTAQQKLTGMQFHHFGAFYKRSWRANDWMWGRLDGAGWLVHVLLDPRRVRQIVDRECEQSANGSGVRAQWFVDKLKKLGVQEIPGSGYALPDAPDGSPQSLTKSMRDKELAFLDDLSEPIPLSLPWTALWLGQVWQQRVLDEELDELANAVINPQPGKPPDWSPTSSQSWAKQVVAASSMVNEALAQNSGDASSPGVQSALSTKYALLKTNAVAQETLSSDKGSPLMAQTVTKAAATASAAAVSVRQMPGVLKPPLITLQTLALGGYRAVSLTKGKAKSEIIAGAWLLVLGVLSAIQNATWAGVGGLILAAIGSYLIVLGTWQSSSRPGTLKPSSRPGTRRSFSGPLLPLLSITLVGAILALTTPVVRRCFFGTDPQDRSLLRSHAHWLGTEWWHPVVVVVAIALAITLTAIAAAKPGQRWRCTLRSSPIIAGAALLVLGGADAIQNATLFGVEGLIAAWIGGCFMILGSWRWLSRPLLALVTLTLVAAVLLLSTHVVREWLFGTDKQDSGLVSAHAYWLGAQWWHPLIVIAAIALAFVLTAIAARKPAEDDGVSPSRRPGAHKS